MTFTTIRGTGGAADTFAGSNGVDTLSFVNQTNTVFLYGAQSNDVVTVAAAAASGSLAGSLNGGAGNDTYTLNGAVFTGSLQGNQGTDTLQSTSAISAATVQGGQGNDTLSFTAATVNSYLNGNKGNDNITVGAANITVSNATIRGGQDIDVITLAGDYSGSLISGDLGNDIINSTATSNYASTTIFGGNGDDAITENAAFGAVLYGEAGNDQIAGGGGNDTLNGGEGNDRLTGNLGGDAINGGGGTDNVVYAALTDTYQGVVATGTALTNPAASLDVLTNIGVGDTITTFGLTAGTAYTAQTTLIGAAAANTIALVKGTWNASTGTWTNSATGIDYLFQWTNTGTVQSVVIDDVGTLSSAVSTAAAANTFTLA